MIAGAAIDRAALRREERYGRDGRALGTFGRNLDSDSLTGLLTGLHSRKACVLQFLTGFAAFRRVLKLLIAKELLFANRPDELLGTINADDRRVLKLCSFFSGSAGNYSSFCHVVRGHIHMLPLAQ